MMRILLVGVVLVVSLLPVKLAAIIVNAKRTSFSWCFLATIVTGTLQLFGFALPGPGTLVAVLLGAAGYGAILRTSYAGGLAIMVLQLVLGVVMFLGLCAVFGVMAGLPRIGPVFV